MTEQTRLQRELRDLLCGEGPWLTGYIDIARRTDPPIDRPGELGDAMQAAVRELALTPSEQEAAARAFIVRADGHHLHRDLAEPLRQNFVAHGPEPVLSPLLEAEQLCIPHTVVTITSRQTDVVTFGTGADPFSPPAVTELGGVGRVGVDGVCRTVLDVVGFTDTELAVVTAVDIDEARLVAAELRRAGVADVHVVDVDDGDPAERLAEATVTLVADAAARRKVAALRRFREARRRGCAVEGMGATSAALSSGRVAELVVHDDVLDRPFDWLGRSAERALDPADSTTWRALIDSLSSRTVDSVLRQAVLDACPVFIVPTVAPSRGPVDGIGGILLDPVARPRRHVAAGAGDDPGVAC